jgi:hypothetical protein
VELEQEFIVQDCRPTPGEGHMAIAVAPNGHIGMAFCCDLNRDYKLAIAVLDQDGQVLFSDLTVDVNLFDSEARIAAVGQSGFIAATKASSDPTYASKSVFASFSSAGLAGILGLDDTTQTTGADLATAPWNGDRVLAVYVRFDATPAAYLA